MIADGGDAAVNPERRAEPGWPDLLEQVGRSSRSQPARSAATWAMEVLRSVLGDAWPAAYWRRNRRLPAFLALSPAHAVAFVELLEWAVRLDEARDAAGFATLRAELRGDHSPHRLLHTALQLEVALLARSTGMSAAVERQLTDHGPVDVLLSTSSGTIPVETFSLLLDDDMKGARAHDDWVGQQMMGIRLEHDVEFDGVLSVRLDQEGTERWLDELRHAAIRVATSGEELEMNSPVGSVRVLPSRAASGARFTGPVQTGRGWDRAVRRLQQKADRAAANGATWLRTDLRDGVWQFSPWSQLPLGEKVASMAGALLDALRDRRLDGVLVSSGACQVQGTLLDAEADVVGGGFGMARSLGPWRGRELVVIPLSKRARPDLAHWRQMYSAEATWLDLRLADRGISSVTRLLT